MTARVTMYKTFLQPRLEYGGALFLEHSTTFHFSSNKIRITPQYAPTWATIEDFQKDASRILLKQRQHTGPLYNILQWTPLRTRWLQQSVWRRIVHRKPGDLETQRWCALFQSFLVSIASTAFNADLFRRFFRELLRIPAPHSITISKHLNADAQHRIILYRRHCFAAGPNTRCFCGELFVQRTHRECLPTPFGPLDRLFKEERYTEIEQTLQTWWNHLRPDESLP